MDATVENLFFYPKAGEFIDHKPLYKAYPDTSMTVMANGRIGGDGHGGSFDTKQNVISIDAPYFNNKTMETNQAAHSTTLHELQHAIQEREGWAKGGSADWVAQEKNKLLARISFLNSELSTAAKGMDKVPENSPAYQELRKTYDDAMAEKMRMNPHLVQNHAYDGYKRLAGEAEARATQARMNLNTEQRRGLFPEDSYDVPMNQLILRGLLGK